MYKQIQRISPKYLNVINKLPVQYSTKPMVKDNKSYEEQLKEFERISNITQRIREKKPQRPPFVKNLLLGQFDYEMLTYPELEKEDWLELEKSVKQIQPFIENNEINKFSQLSNDVLEKFSRERLIGLRTTQLMNGRDLNVTEMCRFTENLNNPNLIYNEQLGIQILLKYGDDKLKKKYLQRLINGESLSAFCVIEALPTNFDVHKNTAVLSSDGKFWTLNGHCKHVINGSTADLLIVLAQNECTIKDDIKDQIMSLFLIERDTGCITSKQLNSISSNLEISNITFDNVQIPAENVIGPINGGGKILEDIYPEFRLTSALLSSSINRQLLKNTIDYHIRISEEPYLIYETDAVREKIAKMAASLYAIDSVTYLTSGLLDNYENQDCELESTITKIFATEETFNNTSSCLSLIGPATVTKDHWCTQLHNEAICLRNLPESNDNLKILLALFGLRYAGQQINDTIKKLRNPFFNAGFVLKRIWSQQRQVDDNPKLNLYLHHYLHPSFLLAASNLEYCVLRLQYATEVLLTRYGKEVVNQHMDLRRIADCLIDIYVMTACIGRASRSYCIGLQHAEYEVALANIVSIDGRERVKNNISKIVDSIYHTNNQNYRLFAKRLFELKDYFPVHPLTRNF